MEIYIVRHGETVWNTKQQLQGNTDIELNERGRALAGITGQNLEPVTFDRIYSSPLIRAYETACLIRGHRNIPIIRDERLKELSFGVYEGQQFKKLIENKNDPFRYLFEKPEWYQAPEKGESLEHICERAADFMTQEIEPQAAQRNRIMIVAHGAMNKAIMCHVMQHGIDQYWSGGLQKNCGVIVLDFDGHTYTVIDENRLYYDPV